MKAQRARWGWLVLAGWLAGCSWVVDPLEASPRCNFDAGKGVCPNGLTCQEGRCKVPCNDEGIETDCNDNVDNDCDGVIDEIDALGRETCGDGIDNDCDQQIDEDSDRDGDGFNYCGNTRPGAMDRPDLVDCNDSHPDAYPRAVEVCDNLDNDCNDLIDDVPAGRTSLCATGLACVAGRCVEPNCTIPDARFACPPGRACSRETKACEAPVSGCANVTCLANEDCDGSTGECRARPKRLNGSACAIDDDCVSGSCIDATALRLSGGGRLCGEACCSDQGCGEGERCFASGTGARSCLPINLLPPDVLPQCTGDSACGAGQQCGLQNEQNLTAPDYLSTNGLTTSVCRTQPLGRGLGEACSLPITCSTHTCVAGASSDDQNCTMPCARSEDCRAFSEAITPRWSLGAPLIERSYCRYMPFPSRADGRHDYVPVCMARRLGETGDGEWGDECSSPRDCRDRGCVGTTGGQKGRCLIACCDDSHCGPNENGRFGTCRPFAIGMGYEMRCEPPAPPPSAESR